jgi:hypothetical protein
VSLMDGSCACRNGIAERTAKQVVSIIRKLIKG